MRHYMHAATIETKDRDCSTFSYSAKNQRSIVSDIVYRKHLPINEFNLGVGRYVRIIQ